MTVFRLDVEGADEAELAAARLGVMVRDMRPWWPLLVPLFIGWMREQFESEGAFGGHPWAPLSANYAAYKSVTYPGKGILVATGELRQAASRPQRYATPTELVLAIVDPKVTFHQEGTDRMPARPLLWSINPVAVDLELTHVADRIAEDMVRRAGFGRV